MLDTLLQINTPVKIRSEHAHLKEEPSRVGARHIEDCLVKGVLWLVEHRLIVVDEEWERYLMQDELLSKAYVQVVCLYLTKWGQTRETCVHSDRQDHCLSRDLAEALESRAGHVTFVLSLALLLHLVFEFARILALWWLNFNWCCKHLGIFAVLSLLGVLIVRPEEAEDYKPSVVEKDEDRPQLEDSNPDVTDLLRYPLRVVEVGNFQAQISKVDEAACETKRINDGLFAWMWMQLVELALA